MKVRVEPKPHDRVPCRDDVRGDVRISVTVPARDEASSIVDVIESIPAWVDRIIVVDDGSVDGTAAHATRALGQREAVVLRTEGLGVGAAVRVGQARAIAEQLTEERWVHAVLDGDGQMDAQDLELLLDAHLTSGRSVQGSRTMHPLRLNGMPRLRRFGTRLLSALMTLAVGRRCEDPQCGYWLLTEGDLEALLDGAGWSGYGYVNHRTLTLARMGRTLERVPVRCIYRSERSGIRIHRFIPAVSRMIWSGLWSRGQAWYLSRDTEVETWNRVAVICGFFGGWLAVAGLVATIAVGAWIPAVSSGMIALLAFTTAHLSDRAVVRQRTATGARIRGIESIERITTGLRR